MPKDPERKELKRPWDEKKHGHEDPLLKELREKHKELDPDRNKTSPILSPQSTPSGSQPHPAGELIRTPRDKTRDIIKAVVDDYGVKYEDILGPGRTKDIAWSRHVAGYVLREIRGMSFPQIGDIFNRDYTTIVASCKKVKSRMETDPAFRQHIEKIIERIKKSSEESAK